MRDAEFTTVMELVLLTDPDPVRVSDFAEDMVVDVVKEMLVDGEGE